MFFFDYLFRKIVDPNYVQTENKPTVPFWPLLTPINWCSTNNPYRKSLCTEIKYQANCGACWAFATATLMEMAYVIGNNGLDPIEMAHQQIVSCATEAFSSNGPCMGGYPGVAISWALGTGMQSRSLYDDYWDYQAFEDQNPPGTSTI